MKTSAFVSIMILFVIIGAAAGAITAFGVVKLATPSANTLIEEFYLTENAVHVSPHSVRKAMAKGDTHYLLVDLRSQEEYEREHIVGAVSVPAYKDPDTSAYGDVERIVGSFKELKEKNPDKDIVVYCYSMPCMTGRKVGLMLAERGIYVKHLGIGWNEWRYFWNLWNHEHEWNATAVEDYIARGSDPGTPKLQELGGICAEGQFGC